MTRQEQLSYCLICEHRKLTYSGLLCGLTNEKSDFKEECQSFQKDETRKINTKAPQTKIRYQKRHILLFLLALFLIPALIISIYFMFFFELNLNGLLREIFKQVGH